jgi:hypothetical protein
MKLLLSAGGRLLEPPRSLLDKPSIHAERFKMLSASEKE